MTILGKITKNLYRDSIALMRIASSVSQREEVTRTEVLIATPANIEALQHDGLFLSEMKGTTPNDIVIVVEADTEETAMESIATVEEMLLAPAVTSGEEASMVYSLRKAIERMPVANLAVLSIPGPFVKREATRALEDGLHLLIFSDNVPLEDEIELKTLADSKGLLVMGPDCGTAIISGMALGFANHVTRGRIGLVGASGTGLQEVTCLIDRAGFGVSHAIGTGTNDVKDAVGGVTLLRGLNVLDNDPNTDVIVIVTKPPDDAVMNKVLEEAGRCSKLVIANFLGGHENSAGDNVIFATFLEDAAKLAVEAMGGSFTLPEEDRNRIDGESSKLIDSQQFVRGVYSGGTFAAEAGLILSQALENVYTNVKLDRATQLENSRSSQKHTCVDLGEDEFTRGKPHPMLEPMMRHERILQEASDPETAVLLLDIVLGYGVHPDPAGSLSKTIEEAQQLAASGNRYIPIVTSVCGTDGDPQVRSEQVAKLRDVGALVLASNAEAARAAAAIAQRTSF